MNVRKLTQLSMMTCIALIIFVIELQIPNPFPIPGIKLGLANIVTIYAAYHFHAHEVMMVVFMRVLLAAVCSGNMMMLPYSIAGSIFCLGGMLLLKKMIEESHIWIASMLCAVLHNTGQMIVAIVVMGVGIVAYFPLLLVSGCCSGLFTGLSAQFLINRMKSVGDLAGVG